MDFEFSEDQRLMQESLRGLLSSRFDIAAARRLADGAGFDAGLWAALAEAGVFAVPVPEAQGGLGLGLVDTVLLLEEFGRALVPAPAAETLLAAELITRCGTPAQRDRWLPGLADGSLHATTAMAEPEGGFGLDQVSLAARRRPGGWVLAGRKTLVPQAAEAGLVLVVARFGVDGRLGIAICPRDADGLTVSAHAGLDLSSRQHLLDFADVAIGEDAVLGGAPDPAHAARLFDLAAAAAAAQQAGIAARLLDEAVDYAKQRVQFGQPIGAFQAIKHKCADMATAVEGARAASYHAALALAEGAPDAARAVSVAKAFCGDAARLASREALQIHGGIGFTWELGLHLWLRRAKALELSWGDTAWHRQRALACALADLGIEA
jgi:alkylation response protein AidB-like acyl-CoA dehydrogenase